MTLQVLARKTSAVAEVSVLRGDEAVGAIARSSGRQRENQVTASGACLR
jgi:hypothetical protein